MGLLRLFLAAAVAIDHFRHTILKPNEMVFSGYVPFGMNAGHAVMCFYVVSGFLISYALSRKYQGAGGTADFYWARFIRIYPLYWALIILYIIINLAGARDGFVTKIEDGRFLDILLGVALIGSDWKVTFGSFPVSDFGPFFPTMNIAWTLGVEVAFYLMAPFILRSNRRALAVLVGSVAIRAGITYAYGFHNTLSYNFMPSTIMFFMLGHFARLLYEKHTFQLGHTLAGFGVLALTLKTWGAATTFDSLWFYAFLACFLVVLPYIFDKTKNMKALNYLGDLTYPLYLIHMGVLVSLFTKDGIGHPALDVLKSNLPPEIAGYVATAGFVSVAILASMAAHYLLEKPAKRIPALLLRAREFRSSRLKSAD
tara:strand:+ start:3585 stop:4691 length:1107 start_codon:yes stop_codon:yes gene_type:complete